MGCDNCTCGDNHRFSSPEVEAAFNAVLEQHGEALNLLAEHDRT